jgi:hypothetical protein
LYKYDLDITEGVENEYSIVQEEGKITLKKDVYKRT